MPWVTWLDDNWFNLLQIAVLLITLWYTREAIRDNTRAVRGQTLADLTDRHRELWSLVYEYPRLTRILDSRVDLKSSPVTADEELFVSMLVAHLVSSHAATRAGLFEGHENLPKDIRLFFTLPIPKRVWATLKDFQDIDFVRFIDDVIEGAR